jgi:hypothetical protein
MEAKAKAGFSLRPFLITAALLGGVLLLLFIKSLRSEFVLFSSDGPLGMNSAEAISLPNSFTGYWMDLFWLGYNSGSTPPDATYLLFWVLGPLYLSKFYAPLSMLILGLCAWFYFRQLGFRPWVCVLGGFASSLNMNYFSNACWGLGSRALALAGIFLALAALANGRGRFFLARCALAGLGVGLSIMEGADNGAIFSLYVAAFGFFVTIIQEGPLAWKAAKGVSRVAIVAVFAALLAAQTLISLVGTAIKGVGYLEPEQQNTEQSWNIATQWSLPKSESLRVIIPGLFGYRTEPDPKGRDYWGAVGRTPGWEEHKQGSPRHSGSGEYAGVLVVLVAFWALAQSLRRNGAYNDFERKIIWFWGVAAVVSLLLAFGRHAPFYRLIYSLPYFSTIRNPIKFMHPLHLALLILFGFGLQGLARLYLDRAASQARSFSEQLKAWWSKANGFEKKWTIGSFAAVALSILGFLVYSSGRPSLVEYLSRTGFESDQAALIARFSAGEVGLFILFLIVSVGLVTVIMSGVFAGRRAAWAGALLGLLLVIDLARANRPWIKYFDYKERYAPNVLTDTLRTKAYQHRVTVASPQLQGLYRGEWLQHQFPYYNIHSLDMAQDPRMAADKETYLKAVTPNVTRYWQLTNTRYVIGGAGGFADTMNQQLDPLKRRFRQVLAFAPVESPSGEYVHLQSNPAGPFALIEFTGALPRARLYSRWQVNTNDQETLKQLVSEQFDPEQTVILADAAPLSPTGDGTTTPGQVEYESYAPKHVKLRANATTPSILLLSDKYDPAWQVTVDGKPQKLLRANFIVRAVHLEPGNHIVEFRFKPALTGLYVTLTAMAAGALLCGFLIVISRRGPVSEARQPERPASQAKPTKAPVSKK